jgi:hypothetical protein
MKLRNLTTILALTLGGFVSSQVWADIVTPNQEQDSAQNADANEVHAVPLIAVPEPATFGIVSVGIAVFGGLLVRNKRSEAPS